MVNKMGTREVEYNCRAPVWLFKDAENNIFQSPQKNLSKKMIIRYKTGHRAGRAVLKTTKRSIRAPKRIWADAHGIAIFRSHYNHRGERLWVIDASDTVPVFMDVVSLDTRRTFRTPINTICFVPQLQTVDETGVRHYITPVAENWFVQWPVGQPQLVERREGPLPDEPTTISSAASRKQSFRDEWATRGGGGSQLCALEREWEDDREEEGVKYLQEFADASDMGEQLVASFDLPMRPVA